MDKLRVIPDINKILVNNAIKFTGQEDGNSLIWLWPKNLVILKEGGRG